MSTLIAIVVVTWLIAIVSSLAAMFFAVRLVDRRRRLAAVLASIAMALGYVGFGHWSPFRFFPQIGYAYTSATFAIQLASSWFFVGPMFLGAAGLVMATWNRNRSNHAV